MSTGVFVVIKDDKERVCCVRHAYGEAKWSLPGGAKEEGECMQVAGIREVHEETSFSIAEIEFVGVFQLIKSPGVVMLCRAQIVAGTLRSEADGEIAERKFFSLTEIQEQEDFFYPAQFKLIHWETVYSSGSEPIFTQLVFPPMLLATLVKDEL